MANDDYRKVYEENLILTTSTMDEVSESTSLLENEERELSERGDLYTALLNAYVTDFDVRHTQNRDFYKKEFFTTVMRLFTLAIFGSICALIIVSIKNSGNNTELSVIITAFGTIISSLIIIPKIIAKYLFPLDEDDKVADMVKTMQRNDCNRINLRNGTKDDN